MALRERGSDFLAEAIELLREADRMHRQFFPLPLGRSGPCWEPPVDIVEGARGLVVRIALPGVPRDSVEVRAESGSLHVLAHRPLPSAPGDSIHRLEIPYGRFERRIELPPGRYDVLGRDVVDGCLTLTLRRIG